MSIRTSLALRWTIAGVAGLLLLAAALFPWHGGTPAKGGFADLGQFRAAYSRVVLGMPTSRLSGLGFDRTGPGAKTLSYLGTVEFFMPRDSRDFDQLDPRVRSCLAAADRCGAWVFRFGDDGDGPFGLAAHAGVEGTRVVFLVRSGRVMWKAMAG